ncbi:MAG TPA: YbiU family protein, partial [Candidatus Binatia bacterium]|nr:YbiU family protein [Candidatus Binatia bacterium]
MLNIRVDKIGEHIKALKQELRAKLPDRKKVMAEVEDEIRREVDEIAAVRAKGGNVVPVLDFKEVEAGRVSEATK